MINRESVEEFQNLTNQLEEKLKEFQKLDKVLKTVLEKYPDDERKISILENEYKRLTVEVHEIRTKAEALKKKL